jgi:hypothetical protein
MASRAVLTRVCNQNVAALKLVKRLTEEGHEEVEVDGARRSLLQNRTSSKQHRQNMCEGKSVQRMEDTCRQLKMQD